ncbi:MAG: tripartite tricarboxylate transporter substrate binding protein [Betaproteobacteria bacterium]|nr:tripartite tricarboxylate transporter substrate binding protein [Betaproteobacteria bacterium]
MTRLNVWLLAGMGLPAAFAATCAAAQNYPTKAIRMIVPFPPGGPNDILGRVMAQKLTEQLGQQVVVDNRGGAGGIIGAELAARAVPDGYTVLFGGTAPLAINPGLHKSLPYDPLKDFAAISLVGTAPSMLVAHPAVAIRTVKDLIDLAKAKPGQLNFASAGIGTPPHLAGELFKSMAGVDMVHVPYKGGGPALTDLLAGQVGLYFSGISSALPFVKEGRLRGIAVTSAKRTAVVPDMPTIAESGLAGYEVGNWYAILAPAATTPAVVTRLNTEINKALAVAEIRKRFLDLAADPVGGTPGELAVYMRSEIAKWAKVIKLAGIKPE